MATETSEHQVMHRRRWIPNELREEFYSAESDRAIMRIAADEGLSEEQAQELLNIAGLATLAFIHPNAVAGEIEEAVGVDSKAASRLSHRLDVAFLGRYRPLLERIYAPPTAVPSNSPIFATVEWGADEHLLRAARLLKSVDDELSSARTSSLRRSEGNVAPVSPSRHSRLHQSLVLAWAEVGYAERLDSEAVIFVSDQEFLDVRRMRLQIYQTTGELNVSANYLVAAKESFELALRLEQHAHLHLLAAVTCIGLGEREPASAHLRRCIDLDPDEEVAASAKNLLAGLPDTKQSAARPTRTGCLGVLLWLP